MNSSTFDCVSAVEAWRPLFNTGMARMPKADMAIAISAVVDKWTGRMAFSFYHTDVTLKPSPRFHEASVGLVTSFLIFNHSKAVADETFADDRQNCSLVGVRRR